jgi:hypothetical protein
MASLDVSLSNAKFYGVTNFDIKVGEKITIFLRDQEGPTRWFSDNDPILSIRKFEDVAVIIAMQEGVSTILILDINKNPIMELTIHVVDGIVEEAVNLSINMDPPIPK